jgi:hypothetical protein
MHIGKKMTNEIQSSNDKKDECKKLWKEAQELTRIFSSILLSKKNK